MLTDEQKDVILEVVKGQEVALSAVAGSGKTSTLLALVNKSGVKNALYIAFNKAIADEATEKFPYYVECRTIHSLAYKYIKPKEVKELNYDAFKQFDLLPNEAKIVINAINKYFNSDEIDMYSFFEREFIPEKNTQPEHIKLLKYMEEVSVQIIEEMLEDRRPVTFGYLIKAFHALLVTEELKLNYELVMLDECADVTGATLAIYNTIKAKMKIMVGDPYQNIYGFMNTVNGFDNTEAKRMRLTKSFRVCSGIAEKVEKFCIRHLDKDFVFTGYDETEEDNSYAYIARTNSSVIKRMIKLLDSHTQFSTVRETSKIFGLVLALSTANSGKEVKSRDYLFLNGIYANYRKYLRTARKHIGFLGYVSKHYSHDIELKGAVGLLMQLAGEQTSIWDIFNRVKAITPNPDIVVATAHSVKGLEYSTVELEDDLNCTILDILEEGGPSTEEELSEFYLYYVATTRAKHKLLNCSALD